MAELQDLLTSMQTASEKVARLEQQLTEAKTEGKGLFSEFQKLQSELGRRFGFGVSINGPVRRTRKPRALAANIAVGGSRLVTNYYQAGKSQAEAKKAAMERALELAGRAGLTAVPDEAIKMIEATLKRRYTKSK
jgi:hypothetical protein